MHLTPFFSNWLSTFWHNKKDLDFSGDSGGSQSIDLDSQSLTLTNENYLGDFSVSYYDEKKESNNILTSGNETL